MSTSYSPRAGSVADRVIHHLRTLAPRAELTSAALAEALGIEHNAIGPSMAPAVAAGAAFVRRKGGHPRAPQFWSLHEHAGATAPRSRQNGAQEDDGLPIRRIVPANGAPPLPIVPPLFAPLAATEHAVPESFTAGQRVSSRDLIEPSAETSAAPPPIAFIPRPTPVATPQPGATFRCGLFSDGEFVLSANGQTLTLDRAQTRQLANFFDRIVTEPAA